MEIGGTIKIINSYMFVSLVKVRNLMNMLISMPSDVREVLALMVLRKILKKLPKDTGLMQLIGQMELNLLLVPM